MINDWEAFKNKKEAELNPKEVDIEIWASKEWEKLNKKQTEDLLFSPLIFQIKRAIKNMPEIYSPLKDKIKKMETFEDLKTFPALVKDTANHAVGFREKIQKTPQLMCPRDLQSATIIYKSGGTRGTSTPTYLTRWDEEVETSTLKKCFEYMGFGTKTKIINTYNPTHKGGAWITKAFQKIGATVIVRRQNESAHEIIDTIKNYDISAIAAVQGPLNEGDTTKKGAGIDFLSMIEAGQDVLESKIETIFITGYTLIPEVIEWAKINKKKLATTLGSTEAIPQATSTIPGKLCKYNNMHLINGPNYVEIVKLESGELVPVKRGETGILLYTTIAREGTIYLRYAPGDSATLIADHCDCGIKTPIISNIKRIDIPEDTIAAGCCIG